MTGLQLANAQRFQIFFSKLGPVYVPHQKVSTRKFIQVKTGPLSVLLWSHGPELLNYFTPKAVNNLCSS